MNTAMGGSSITNTATATSDTPDPIPSNNSSSVTTIVCERMCCRSRRLKRSGRSTRPPTASRQAVGSSLGIWKLLRT